MLMGKLPSLTALPRVPSARQAVALAATSFKNARTLTWRWSQAYDRTTKEAVRPRKKGGRFHYGWRSTRQRRRQDQALWAAWRPVLTPAPSHRGGHQGLRVGSPH